MKKNDALIFAILDLVYLVVACLAGAVFADLAVKLVNYFTAISYAASAVIHAIVSGAVSIFLCGLFAHRDGYRYAAFSWGGSLLSGGIAAVVHFGLGLATRFAPIAFGPTRNLAGVIAFGENFTKERVPKISLAALAVTGIVMLMVYVGAFLIGNRLGCLKRLRDRADTMKKQTASK